MLMLRFEQDARFPKKKKKNNVTYHESILQLGFIKFYFEKFPL